MEPRRRQSFYQNLKKAYVSAYDKQNKELTDVLGEIIKYTKRGDFVVSRNYAEFYDVVLEPNSVAAEALGVSEAAYRVRLKSMSDKLYDIFGGDFFSVIEGDNGAEVARTRFMLIGADLDDLLIKGIKSYINDLPIPGEYEAVELKTELWFLEQYSKARLDTTYDQLDLGKLGYLVSVLRGENGTPEERAAFLKKLGHGTPTGVAND